MDEIRFKHFATQQLMTRKRCHSDSDVPCSARIEINKAQCVECAERYYQKLSEIEEEDLKNNE